MVGEENIGFPVLYVHMMWPDVWIQNSTFHYIGNKQTDLFRTGIVHACFANRINNISNHFIMYFCSSLWTTHVHLCLVVKIQIRQSWEPFINLHKLTYFRKRSFINAVIDLFWWAPKLFVYAKIYKDKRPMGHIAHLRKQFKSINTYDYIITLINLEKKPLLTSWELIGSSFEQTVFSLIRNYLPSEKGGDLHMHKLESPWPKDALCQVWLKLAQWFWRRRFF